MISKDRSNDLRSLLVSCHRASTARQYASDLVAQLAQQSASPVCIWMNYSGGRLEAVAWTQNAEPYLREAILRCTLEPCVENEAAPGNALRSLISVPMLFRSVPAGVLALANRPDGYTQADLEPLLETARIALVEYEDRRLSGDAGLNCAPGENSLASFVHKLRQPLSIIDTCAFFLDMVLPESPEKVRAQIAVMQEQVAVADRILTEAVQPPSAAGPSAGPSAAFRIAVP
ncbi:MAG: hypothetical protein M1541_06810 [Acidobacteria bacterium]|nr:hypothetical protein [Acidobacteriota bacterium]